MGTTASAELGFQASDEFILPSALAINRFYCTIVYLQCFTHSLTETARKSKRSSGTVTRMVTTRASDRNINLDVVGHTSAVSLGPYVPLCFLYEFQLLRLKRGFIGIERQYNISSKSPSLGVKEMTQ